ncbi:unnamed protein product [Dovyalis caffra]|uniref:OTU domain-containing protein n=1 Tax=Dovyalis caffra TaxID=77055 RepID=A0AAV1S059_9ROSI|nr:unnamed protein product [Dovyalis caffra]
MSPAVGFAYNLPKFHFHASQHVPRINGEIPSIDEATSDHERLLNRYCFRALSDQIYNTPDRHKIIRRRVVYQLKSHPEIYEGYVPMEYGDYLRKMSKSGEWGDHVTLQAAADSYGVKILVMTSFKDTCYIEILPVSEKSKGVSSRPYLCTKSQICNLLEQFRRKVRSKGNPNLGELEAIQRVLLSLQS